MCGLATALHLPSIPSAGFKASLWVPTMPWEQSKMSAPLVGGCGKRERERERERDLREETVYCSPAWDCGKGCLV